VVLLLSMSVHEMMHAFAADWLGDDTARLMGRLTINPLAHIDPFLTVAVPLLLLLSGAPPFGAAKPVQVNFNRLRWGEFGGAIVGMIGPLTNLVIAGAAALIFQHFNLVPGGVAYTAVGYAVLLNLSFCIFNSIPWPPLDGSRLLYAFAPRPLQEVMESIERTGLMSLVIFLFLFYYLLSPWFSEIISHLMNAWAPGFLTYMSL
jgi:Zn-dependent protease